MSAYILITYVENFEFQKSFIEALQAEAVAQSCSVKKVFLEILQNS